MTGQRLEENAITEHQAIGHGGQYSADNQNHPPIEKLTRGCVRHFRHKDDLSVCQKCLLMPAAVGSPPSCQLPFSSGTKSHQFHELINIVKLIDSPDGLDQLPHLRLTIVVRSHLRELLFQLFIAQWIITYAVGNV